MSDYKTDSGRKKKRKLTQIGNISAQGGQSLEARLLQELVISGGAIADGQTILNNPRLTLDQKEVELRTRIRINRERQKRAAEAKRLSDEEKKGIFIRKVMEQISPNSFVYSYLKDNQIRIHTDKDEITIFVGNAFIADSLERDKSVNTVIQSVITEIGGSTFKLELDDKLRKLAETSEVLEKTTHTPEDVKKQIAFEKRDLGSICNQLFRELTSNCSLPLSKQRDLWDDLIIGNCNRAGRSVIYSAYEFYCGTDIVDKIIFMYGESATGKTALLQGIIWKIQHSVKRAIEELRKLDPATAEDRLRIKDLKKRARFKARYITGLSFKTEYSEKVGGKVMFESEFMAPFLDLDLVVIDDIQALLELKPAAKTFTRLYELIDQLYNAGKMVIIASDTLYHKLSSFPSHLFTRIGEGTRVSLRYPDTEKRDVLEYYLKKLNIEVSESVAPHIIALLASDRIQNFRDIKSVASTYNLNINSGMSPIDAVQSIKDMFQITDTKTEADIALEIFRVAASFVDQEDYHALFNPDTRRFNGVIRMDDVKNMHVLADDVRDAAIYAAWRIARPASGSRANVQVKAWCGYESTSPIKRVRELFENKLAGAGFEVTPDMADPHKPAAYTFNQIYQLLRDYKVEMIRREHLPLFNGIINEKNTDKKE